MGVCTNWETACRSCKDAGYVSPPLDMQLVMDALHSQPVDHVHAWLKGRCLYCNEPKDQTLYARYGAVSDVENAADLEECKKLTHDGVVADLGDRRCSGVTWRIYDPDPGLEILELQSPTGEARHVAELKSFLRDHPNGALVIATAEVDDSAGIKIGGRT